MITTKSAAVLTIHRPGSMTASGRKEIADWLRRQAKDLVKLGAEYSDTKFTARWFYQER